MKLLRHTFFLIFLGATLLGCKKSKISEKKATVKKVTYNQKANDLIVQRMDYNKYGRDCNCILEIPIDNPDSIGVNRKSEIAKKLELKQGDNIDSLIKVANTFTWDEKLLKENNIKLIRYDSSLDRGMGNSEESARKYFKARNDYRDKIFKNCRRDILSIQRPIFDKEYKHAVMITVVPFTCMSPTIMEKYKLESGKWVEE